MIRTRPSSIGWGGHIAPTGRKVMYIIYWSESQMEDQDVDGWIIFKLIIDRMGWYSQDWCCPVQGPVKGYCERGNEPSWSIKCWEVFE
jgi:hypothetical protein